MSVHSDFILAPVSDILCDTSTITHSMSWGIEMYPLWDNIMQSIFMKMTGAQEQKMKCICCLYIHRNRCAHNLTSYQQNRPSLEILSGIDSVYENYYIRFALLIIIDKIMITLYQIFQHEANHLKLF